MPPRYKAADSGVKISCLRVDGGASTNDTMMQFQADILGIPVQRPVQTETTALGAAYLAGLGVGLLRGTAAMAKSQEIDATFRSSMRPAAREARVARWLQAVDHAKGWARPSD